MDDSNINQANVFPDKPTLEKDNNSLFKSIGSVALFVGAFYLFFNKDINFIIVLVLVLFIHELGHFIAMKYFNYKDVQMFFIPLLGALVTGDKHEISQRQRAIILLAGPVPGIIIGLILYAIGIGNNDQNLIMAANIFIFLNIFNLLPLTPLDGGNLLMTLFFSKKETLQIIFVILSATGLTIIALYLESYVLLVIPFFLLTRIIHESKIKKVKAKLEEDGIDYNKTFEELTNREYWLIREQIVSNWTIFENVNPKDYTASKHEKQIINQIKSLVVKMSTQDLTGKDKFLFVGSWLLFCIGPFIVFGLIFNSNSLFQLTTEDYKERMIQNCIDTAGEPANQYPEELRQYCECAMNTITKQFSKQEMVKHKGLTEDEVLELYMPYIQGCISEIQGKMLLDTTMTVKKEN